MNNEEIFIKNLRVSWVHQQSKEELEEILSSQFEEQIPEDLNLDGLRKLAVNLIKNNLKLGLKLQFLYSVDHKQLALEGLDELAILEAENRNSPFNKIENKDVKTEIRTEEGKSLIETEDNKEENRDSESESDKETGKMTTETKIEIEKFMGKNDDYGKFMKKFEILALIKKWKDEEKVLYFPLYLSGYAFQYFLSDLENEKSWTNVKSKMEKRFKASPLQIENQLYARVQGLKEDPIEFITEIGSKGKAIGLSDSTICRIVMRGLHKEIIEKIGMLDNSTLEKIEENILKYQNEKEILNGKIHDDMTLKVKQLEEEIAKLKAKKDNEDIEKLLEEALAVRDRRDEKETKDNRNYKKYDDYYGKKTFYCKICKRKGHHTNQCWYKDKKKLNYRELFCNNCKKKGHETTKCWHVQKN